MGNFPDQWGHGPEQPEPGKDGPLHWSDPNLWFVMFVVGVIWWVIT